MKLIDKRNLCTFFALLLRDLHVMKSSVIDVIINNIIILTILYVLFGILGPYINIPTSQLPMIFVGFLVGNIIYVGFNQALKDVLDLDGDKLINYQLTLPLTLNWTVAHYIARYKMWLFLATIPSFVLTKLLLGSLLPFASINWFAFIFMYGISMTFCAALFLLFTFGASPQWFYFNIWQRILWPMNALGCTIYIWHNTYTFSNRIGTLLLINPQTYLSEGMRAALLPHLNSISVCTCFGVTACISLITIIYIRHTMKKRLDCL